ncbi:MAG: phenylalanine--tRNA ligase subunit beta [Phycisphaerae bacterium]|nr:phenylalanine--tRNA ligase subunit beta [Phycisphaerae bacterium]
MNWIRDFVDLPADLDCEALAERFTMTTAEVEGVERIHVDATGLVAGKIVAIEALPDTRSLSAARVDVGGTIFDTVTAAPDLRVGDKVIFAPPGATVRGIGTIGKAKVAGRTSAGMIVAGEALGLAQLTQKAVLLPPRTESGSPIEEPSLFDDWIIEIDNKSITHRPDLWGHYGIAREIAAICRTPLRPYPVVAIETLISPKLPEIPIVIDDPAKCPRYSGLVFEGVRPQPAPLWMQVRLSHTGVRPIDLLVDLTNYIMLELGQPMHAFDGGNVDRIEVAAAREGETFTTLDGVERAMPAGALMIQCNRKSVALAGIMGGANTEVTAETKRLLLESANFEPATIRRCATALGHRTEASARFEKSLDPANTVLAIQRFVHLAAPELPELKCVSRLSDGYPKPAEPVRVTLDLGYLHRFMGREVATDEVVRILRALDFGVTVTDGKLEAAVPSFRATKDIAIEADLIEEVARCVGYDNIESVLPEVTVRHFEPDRMHRLERRSLELLCGGLGYSEIHGYIWYEAPWLRRLGFEPGDCATLRNPASLGGEPAPHLRQTLVPGLLHAVELNRHHVDRFDLVEVGGAYTPSGDGHIESRRLALVRVVPGRKPAHEDAILAELKTHIQTWAMQVVEVPAVFTSCDGAGNAPWLHEAKTSGVQIGGVGAGFVTVVPLACRRTMEEHLAAWSIALAEIDLSAVAPVRPAVEPLPSVPTHPQTDLDFSVLADAARRYADLSAELAGFSHPLLRRLAFVGSYEGGAVPAGKRSLTFRARVGHADRTLSDADLQEFRQGFLAYLARCGLEIRG